MALAIGSMNDEQRAARDEAVLAANKGKSNTTDPMGQINKDFTFFLRMLTTQLQNQDPTQPMDVSQMTQQIAQYSGVEQQIKTNTQLEALLKSNKQSQLSTAVSYIGKEVETNGNVGTLQRVQDGTQTGKAEFEYTLPANVATVKVTIKNSAGEVVYTGNGPVAEGKNPVTWNGVSTVTNKQVEAGDYTIEVEAKDAQGDVFSGISTGGARKLAYAPTNYAQAVFSYMLPKGASSAQITILNAAGQAVFTGAGTLKDGRNVVVWDGKNSFTGGDAAEGKYTIQVKAKDAKGGDITVETRAVGQVNTVETDKSGNIILNVGEAQVKFDDILAVRDATPFYSL